MDERASKFDLGVRILINLVIRFALALAYLVVSILVSFSGLAASLLWGTVLALAFAYATTRFVGRSTYFILVTVLLVTVAFPFVILCWIGVPVYHSWRASAGNVAIMMLTLNPFHSLYMLVPGIAVAGFGYFDGRRAGPSSAKRLGGRNLAG